MRVCVWSHYPFKGGSVHALVFFCSVLCLQLFSSADSYVMQISELVVSPLISRLSLSHVSISFGTCMVQLCVVILFIVWYFSSLMKYG